MREKLAVKYYKAYSVLCHSLQENISGGDAEELREIRMLIFNKYKKYDPDNSFNVTQIDNQTKEK